MPRLRGGAVPDRPREQPFRLPEMRAPPARAGARAHRPAARPRGPLRDRLRGGADRQPQVQGPEEISGAARGGARRDGRDRRARGDAGQRQGRSAGARLLRIRLHGRIDGLGRRRALRARRARRFREPHSVRLHFGVGRRADAGGRQLALPDGEDHRRSAGADEGAAALRVGPDRSDDGRRVGVVRVRCRSRAGGAGRADRLRRPARDRADRARKAAGRFPARRVPDRKRRARHDRRPPTVARRAVATARDADRAARSPAT